MARQAVFAVLLAAVFASSCGSPAQPGSPALVPATPPPARSSAPDPACDASLWSHVHDVKRLAIHAACQTVTGVIVESHSNADGDGDIDMDIAVDPQYRYLLNQGNLTKLKGNLHIEAICQAPVHPKVRDAIRSCASFHGTVAIPPVGAHVQVTGVYVDDTHHGWMEIHPISVLSILR